MTQIELINPLLIAESAMNPRRFFTKESVQELSESISKQGLLQPITVRPFPEMKIEAPKHLKGKPCYQIVCGARRYKASILAGLETIPCIVREMTDEEAFDAMITENLQRKDVEPMDEARAFNELHKRGTSFEELAARFGKSVSFIRLRIKLNDLVPELAELLEKKELQISHAQEICKLSIEEQSNIFSDHYSPSAKNWNKWSDENIQKIKRNLSQTFKDLDRVGFDKTDCIDCKSRCGANVLFLEYESNSCQNPICYKQKDNDYRVQLAKEKADSGSILFFSKDYQNEVTEKLTELGYELKPFDYSKYRKIGIEELPERESYDEDDEDHQSEEEYQEECSEAQKAIDEQNEQIANGELIPCWAVNIYAKDEFFYIKNNGIQQDGATPEALAQSNKIVELQSKDKRNAEIKVEKITEELKMLISKSDYDTYSYPTTDLEKEILIAAMISKCDWSFIRQIERDFDKNISYLENCKAIIGAPLEAKIIRAFIKNHVTSYASSVREQLTALSKEAYNDDSLKIELKHEETYLKRKEKIDEQIKLL